jgi:hypothetical protein
LEKIILTEFEAAVLEQIRLDGNRTMQQIAESVGLRRAV